jgi:hypothetical protein
MIKYCEGGLGSLERCIKYIFFGIKYRHLWGRSNGGFMRKNRFRFCLSMRLQFFYRHFPKSFVRDFEIIGHLDRV